MKDEKQTSGRPGLLFGLGLLAIVLLVATGSWYLLGPGSRSAASTAAPAPELTRLAPEEEADPESPRTPTPGFFDDFEDGPDPVWAVHYGDVLARDGHLTSNVGAGIAAGDETWKDYQVDFEVDTGEVGCAFTDSSNSLGVRVDTFDYAYYFVFSRCEAAWSRYPGGIFEGQENLIPETRTSLDLNPVKHFTIRVQGSNISAYEAGVLLSAFQDTAYPTGGIFLQVEAGTRYDDLRVTLLP